MSHGNRRYRSPDPHPNRPPPRRDHYLRPPRGDTYDAQAAKMVVEVLSPSNRGVAWQRKLEEYRGSDGLAYILLVESDTIDATLFQRATGSEIWTTVDAGDRTAVFNLPAIGCTLALTEVYEGIDFEPVG